MKKIILVILILVSLCGCKSDDLKISMEINKKEKVYYRFTIFDVDTEQPISGALVELRTESNKTISSTTSQSGYVAFWQPITDKCVCYSISKAGYKTQSDSIGDVYYGIAQTIFLEPDK